MDVRLLKKSEFHFLQRQLDYCEERKTISESQKESMLNLYGIKEGFGFVSIVLTVAAVLIGLGVLTFIASNWAGMTKASRMAIILIAYIGLNFISYVISDNLPRVARSLVYIGVLVFGAGIFLIGQMFNFGGEFVEAFLLWSVGTLCTGLMFKDKLLVVFSQLLLMIYIAPYFGNMFSSKIPFMGFVCIPIFYYINKVLDYSKVVTFFNNLLSLELIMFLLLNNTSLSELGICLVFFAIGVAMYFLPIDFHKGVFKTQGAIVFGITGVLLTIQSLWNSSSMIYPISFYPNAGVYESIVFAVLFITFLLWLTRKEDLIPLIFICITIFRYYVTEMYGFMEKSLFFLTAGLILLLFGFYIEYTRRRLMGGMRNEQKNI